MGTVYHKMAGIAMGLKTYMQFLFHMTYTHIILSEISTDDLKI